MAVTNPVDVASSIPRIYGRRVMRDMKRETFWDKLATPEGGGGAVIVVEELLNKPGETVYFQVTAPLTGAGQSGDVQTLEGNEEKMSTEDCSVTPVYYRHGVRVNNRAQKKSLLNLRDEGKMRLAEWGGDKIDTLRFEGYLDPVKTDASLGTHQLRRVGGVSDINAIVAANKMTLAEISKTKYLLRDAGGKGWDVGGKKFFILVTDQWVEYDIKVGDPVYAQAQREANTRGDSNPIFTGAEAVWDGVIIKVADRVPAAINTNGAPCIVAKSIMFGKEAFVEAWGSEPSWAERDFDYGHEFGIGYGFDFGAGRGWECRSIQLQSSAVPQI